MLNKKISILIGWMTAILVLISLLGFSANQNSDSSKLVHLKLKQTKVVSDNFDTPDTLFLELGIIPGSLYGAPLKDKYWMIDMSLESKPSIDLKRFGSEIVGYSAANIESEYNKGLNIEPASTKYLRLSTFGYDAGKDMFLSGGLEDDEENFIMLAYFSEPCTLLGEIDFGVEGIYKHDIRISEAGLHALIAVHDGNKYEVTKLKKASLIFVVFNNYIQ